MKNCAVKSRSIIKNSDDYDKKIYENHIKFR